MGIFRDLYFSSESYKIALDINKLYTDVYRMLLSERCMNRNAVSIVREIKQKLNTLSTKAKECTYLVAFIKVPMPNGHEVPVMQYINSMNIELDKLLCNYQ